MKKRAFTLIELLVVIAIISILATIIIVSYNNVQARSRDSKRKADLQAIASATEMFYADNKFYPYGFNQVDVSGNQLGNNTYSTAATSQGTCQLAATNNANDNNRVHENWSCLIINGYIQQFPTDPSGSGNYYLMGATNFPSGTGQNVYGYKITTDIRADRFETSGTVDATCKSSAADFADMSANTPPRNDTQAAPVACKRLQVSKGRNAQNWVITNVWN